MQKRNLRLTQWTTRATKFPRFFALAFLALSALVLSGCQASQELLSTSTTSQTTAELAITNVTLIDSANGTRTSRSIFISGDKIVALTSDPTEITANRTIDGTGKYLIPGLWDMHVHITYEPELTAAMPDLFLSWGITSVRDTGGLLPALLPEVKKWRAPGATAPRIFFSGPLLDGGTVVYNGEAVPEIGTANATPTTARANIAKLKAAGVDFVKTYELVKPEVFRALVNAAREANLPIASHVPLMMTAREAGPLVDSMEHLRNIELDCSANTDALLEARSEQILNPGDTPGIKLRGDIHSDQRPKALESFDEQECNAVIAALRNTIQVPTLRLNTSALYQPFDRSDWRDAIKRLPTERQEPWLTQSETWAKRRSTLPRANGEFSLRMVGQLHAAGVPIGAGTDTPIGSALPGYSLHTELERLVEAGLSELEAINSATVQPANFVNKSDTMGAIAPGYVADLVLLEQNPLDDIRNTRSINTVISKGVAVWQSN